MSTSMRNCKYCKAKRLDDLAPCPHCGSGARESLDSRIETHTPTLLIGTNRPEEGVQGLVVAAPGATSRTSLSDQGVVKIEVCGSKGIGRAGEFRVKHILYDRLARDHRFSRKEGAKDQDGEDDLVYIDGRSYVVQIVTAINGDCIGFHQANLGTANTSTSLNQIASWITETIKAKALKTDPPNTILALDANLLGVLASQSLVDTYRRAIVSAGPFRFAAIWMVGPTVETCFRLDNTEDVST